MGYNFIKTKDSETAEKLRKYLNELPKDGEFFIFVNDPTVMNFESKFDNCLFTNKLNL